MQNIKEEINFWINRGNPKVPSLHKGNGKPLATKKLQMQIKKNKRKEKKIEIKECLRQDWYGKIQITAT